MIIEQTEYEKRIAWLAALKVGDKVYATVSNSSWGTNGAICKIDKVTPTQFVIGSYRYNRIDGRERGGYGDIQPVTPELIAKLKEQKDNNTIKYFNDWAKLPLADRETIVAIIERYKESK